MSTPSKRPPSQASSDAPTPSRRTRSSQQLVVPETPQRSTGTPTNGERYLPIFHDPTYYIPTTTFKFNLGFENIGTTKASNLTLCGPTSRWRYTTDTPTVAAYAWGPVAHHIAGARPCVEPHWYVFQRIQSILFWRCIPCMSRVFSAVLTLEKV